MIILRSLGLTAFALAGTLAAACGSADGSGSFTEDGGVSSGTNASGGSQQSSGGIQGNTGDGGGNGTSGALGDGGACQAAGSQAQRLPLTMLIALDQSQSMGNGGGGNGQQNKAKRWTPVTKALKAFWANPSTEGISANLRLFPHASHKCDATEYATADVPLTPLPNAPVFEAKLVDNPNISSTPTRAVLRAAAAEADAIVAANPATKVVIVLVTDGKPQGCDGSDGIDAVKGEIAGKSYPTYAIGIGASTDTNDITQNMKDIAAAGGTTAFFVGSNADDAAATETDFTNAMNEIRTSLSTCEVLIPPPPPGQTFDSNKVNVTLTSGAGVPTELGYDATCSGPGWSYDNPTSPTKIVLCASSCEAIKADPAAQVDVAFGCATRAAGPH